MFSYHTHKWYSLCTNVFTDSCVGSGAVVVAVCTIFWVLFFYPCGVTTVGILTKLNELGSFAGSWLLKVVSPVCFFLIHKTRWIQEIDHIVLVFLLWSISLPSRNKPDHSSSAILSMSRAPLFIVYIQEIDQTAPLCHYYSVVLPHVGNRPGRIPSFVVDQYHCLQEIDRAQIMSLSIQEIDETTVGLYWKERKMLKMMNLFLVAVQRRGAW